MLSSSVYIKYNIKRRAKREKNKSKEGWRDDQGKAVTSNYTARFYYLLSAISASIVEGAFNQRSKDDLCTVRSRIHVVDHQYGDADGDGDGVLLRGSRSKRSRSLNFFFLAIPFFSLSLSFYSFLFSSFFSLHLWRNAEDIRATMSFTRQFRGGKRIITYLYIILYIHINASTLMYYTMYTWTWYHFQELAV